MDSVTQFILGASVGEVCLGKKLGNKALLIGGIAGTIPDLDVFTQWFVQSPDILLRVHRSYSHAAFIQLFMAIPFVFLSYNIFKKEISVIRLYVFWYLAFLTHTLLDCCTTYGTQLLLPFSNKLVAFNNVAVVDIFYTLIFLVLLLICLFFKRDDKRRIRFAYASIIISSIYLLMTFYNKHKAFTFFEQQLKTRNINYTNLSVSPTLFSNFLWNMIAYDDTTMYLAEYSLLQKNDSIDIISYKRNTNLLANIKNTECVQTLLWFSDGKYIVEAKENDTLQFYVTKWGRTDITKTSTQGALPFYYKLYTENGAITFKHIKPDSKDIDRKKMFNMFVDRILQ